MKHLSRYSKELMFSTKMGSLCLPNSKKLYGKSLRLIALQVKSALSKDMIRCSRSLRSWSRISPRKQSKILKTSKRRSVLVEECKTTASTVNQTQMAPVKVNLWCSVAFKLMKKSSETKTYAKSAASNNKTQNSSPASIKLAKNASRHTCLIVKSVHSATLRSLP